MTLILTKPRLQIAFLLNKGFFAVIISPPREQSLTTTDILKVLFSQLYKPSGNTLAFVGPRQHSDLSLVIVTSVINLEVSAGEHKRHEKILSSRIFINRSEWCVPISLCQQRQRTTEDITSSKNPPQLTPHKMRLLNIPFKSDTLYVSQKLHMRVFSSPAFRGGACRHAQLFHYS